MTSMRRAVVTVSALVLAACAPSVQQRTARETRNSPIVREVANAGAGDPRGYTEAGLDAWFARRADFAAHVYAECRPARAAADAVWINTPEGLICSSVQYVMAFQFVPPIASGSRGW
jgi:hypothetical protein